MMSAMTVLVFLILALGCFELPGFANAELVREEVDALQEIATMMGSTYWNFNAVSCKIEMVGLTTVPPKGSENDVICECLNEGETDCHVVRIKLKGYNLPGVLPPQMVKLPYLREIDLVYNYLNGSIPREWASMQLTFISLLVNRLSGEIPKELGNITSLRYLCLEANQFSGNIPMELGDLVNLETMILSSNRFTGNLPTSLARLINLTDFRINDNSLNGTIPGFIQNWRKLERLEMHASGLEGPIPPNISQLSKLLQIKISDIGGPSQEIPQLNNATSLQRVVLRSCNLIGELPAYLWTLDYLEMLDVSFNNLVGKIPSTIPPERLKFIFLTGNSLSGDIPDSILTTGSSIDLAYNNFTLQDPKQPACRENMNMNLNLYQSSSVLNSSRPTLPCMKTLNCPRYSNCLHINSGGKDISVKENKTTYLYKGDGDVEGGTATYFLNTENFWGFASTGDFMDDNNYQNARYTASLESSNLPELYLTARISPISLSYFHYCLENGKYTVTLHFAEIQFTNDKSYSSLGKRFFDIYVQERLVWKNFNIRDEVQNAQTPFLLPVRDVNVTNNKLEIRLYYAGRGTTRIPARGVYGPIISALSVVSVDSKACSTEKQKKAVYVVVGIVGASCVILMLLGILWWKGYFPIRRVKRKENDPDLPTGTFSLSQIEAATDEFDPTNKIGEGGFGPVFKGILSDGTVIAVKQLSSKSKQGNREFLNEIGMISCLKHPNVVKLHGFCVEGDQLLLVYEYMENNSLAGALFGDSRKLDWPTRNRICMGIARGLAFLHEESRLKIVHRDIKATNVLLDKNLNPKISDFGLARLDEEEKTHISTRIAGTIGYMAPEYALWGYLTYKVDVYSFGVVVLEIISGKNNSYMPSNNCICLLDWACYLQQTGSLLDIVDDTVRTEMNKEEAEKVIKVALLCTNASPTLRPTMSEVVSMLEGRAAVPESIPAARTYNEDLRFKAMRDLKREAHDQS